MTLKNTNENCSCCYELSENYHCLFRKCIICRETFCEDQMYEMRSLFGCEKHIKEMQNKAQVQKEVSDEIENKKTEKYHGLDFGDSPRGKANREIFRGM